MYRTPMKCTLPERALQSQPSLNFKFSKFSSNCFSVIKLQGTKFGHGPPEYSNLFNFELDFQTLQFLPSASPLLISIMPGKLRGCLA